MKNNIIKRRKNIFTALAFFAGALLITGCANKDNSSNLDFDFSSLETTLKDENNNVYKETCTQLTESTGDSLGEVDKQKNELSDKTINNVIKKLKSADKLEKDVTFSFFGCSPKGVIYSIEDKDSQTIFSIMYANDEATLLVSYNNTGYAFKFESKDEIENFIENLK